MTKMSSGMMKVLNYAKLGLFMATRRVKVWKALDKPWRWCYNRLTEIHALPSWGHGSTSMGAWGMDAEGFGHLLVDDHIPAYAVAVWK